ncbi:MAG: hypothetical protein OHK0046_43040 [Anaerolineae bacterium]
MIDEERLQQEISQLDREIATWKAKTSDRTQVKLELQICATAIQNLRQAWEYGDDKDRQGMAQHLFEYIVYDLDKHQITHFELKAWAAPFLQRRMGHSTLRKQKTLKKRVQM